MDGKSRIQEQAGVRACAVRKAAPQKGLSEWSMGPPRYRRECMQCVWRSDEDEPALKIRRLSANYCRTWKPQAAPHLQA